MCARDQVLFFSSFFEWLFLDLTLTFFVIGFVFLFYTVVGLVDFRFSFTLSDLRFSVFFAVRLLIFSFACARFEVFFSRFGAHFDDHLPTSAQISPDFLFIVILGQPAGGGGGWVGGGGLASSIWNPYTRYRLLVA